MPARYENNIVPVGWKQLKFYVNNSPIDVIPVQITWDWPHNRSESFDINIPVPAASPDGILQTTATTLSWSTWTYKWAYNPTTNQIWARDNSWNWKVIQTGKLDMIASVTPTATTATVSLTQDATRIANGVLPTASATNEWVILQVIGSTNVTPTSWPLLGIWELNTNDFIICENSNWTRQWKKFDNTDDNLSSNIIAVWEKFTSLTEVVFENLRVRRNAPLDRIEIATVTWTIQLERVSSIVYWSQWTVINGWAWVDATFFWSPISLATTFVVLWDAWLTWVENRTYDIWTSTGLHYKINAIRKWTTTTNWWITFVVEKIWITTLNIISASNGARMVGTVVQATRSSWLFTAWVSCIYGNLQVRMTTTWNRSFEIATVWWTLVHNGTSFNNWSATAPWAWVATTATTRHKENQTLTTAFTRRQPNLNFLTAWATQIIHLQDTWSWKLYRITWIVWSWYNNNHICIEELI